MKNVFYLALILLTFISLAFLRISFAQETPPAYTVRLVYLLPSDREAQPDIDAKFDALIKKTQAFFADEMERHGFGRKTFRFESDANGNAIVHHVTSAQNDEYFQNWGSDHQPVRAYFGDQFDLDKYIFLEAIDVSKEVLGYGEFCGYWGGIATVPASGDCFSVSIVAHELGHGFGLTHNFHDDSYIMSYGSQLSLSACAAQWLDVSPFFNPDKVVNRNHNTEVELLSSTFDASPPHVQRLRFELTDPDGLHQVQLITQDASINYSVYVDCRSLRGERAIAEFEIIAELKRATLHVIDRSGNYMFVGFDISDTVPPRSVAVDVPDPNLAVAIRAALGIASTEPITSFALSRLKELSATDRGITDLSGLEHAGGLRRLFLAHNQISDLTPLAKLTRLQRLFLEGNPLRDIKPLAALTQLNTLFLDDTGITDLRPLRPLSQLSVLTARRNGIDDITPLAELRHLTHLYFYENKVSDLRPLAKLERLQGLDFAKNEIADIHPIARLISLKGLHLGNNKISDIRPLPKGQRLKVLFLENNKIVDVSVLSDMVYLESVVLYGNPIRNKKPLLALLQKNPDVKIYLKDSETPLPVTLSVFRAERTNTGVLLKWTTESEIDNAGFYIYRSQTKDGEFKVVNAKLIQGAGTTGERTEYRWTDRTAEPNTVYYYRIEDVSHAGVRTQLATVRLKGLVSASDKQITSWAHVKAEQ